MVLPGGTLLSWLESRFQRGSNISEGKALEQFHSLAVMIEQAFAGLDRDGQR